MTRIETYLLARLIVRYLRQIEKKDIMLDNILPIIQKMMGKDSMEVVKALNRLFSDWKEEIRRYLIKGGK